MIVAIVAMGSMGSAIAAQLTKHGIATRTSIAGRSAASIERAREAGTTLCDDSDVLAGADLFLSIVPPDTALHVAERFAPHLRALDAKPVFVDCNAISAATARAVEAVVLGTGAAFVDAGIIGGPPTPSFQPRFYACGTAIDRFVKLREYGFDIADLAAPAGAASTFKIAYAALTKGLAAIGTAIEIGANEAGIADALRVETLRTQPHLRAWLDRRLGEVPSKAYRWAGEMDEVAEFLGGPESGSAIYTAIGDFYRHLATEQK